MARKNGHPDGRRPDSPARTEPPPAWILPFLESLSVCANVTQAVQKAGACRSAVYEYRSKHPEFAAQWEAAYQAAVDDLEAEAWRRAVRGTDEPVFQRGEHVGDIRKYSDALMVELLRGHRPKRYRNRIEITVREEARRIAERLGLDADQLIAEAERIARGEVPV